jgi:hypothetical protein
MALGLGRQWRGSQGERQRKQQTTPDPERLIINQSAVGYSAGQWYGILGRLIAESFAIFVRAICRRCWTHQDTTVCSGVTRNIVQHTLQKQIETKLGPRWTETVGLTSRSCPI